MTSHRPKSSAADDIVEAKKALRARMKAWRSGLSAAQMAQAGEALALHGLAFLPSLAPTSVVSGYASCRRTERVAAAAAAAPRRPPTLPSRHAGQGQAAHLPRLDAGRRHGQGVWGIAKPKPDKPDLEPDVLLVPLLAFDRAGWRMGYGGGFYDRTLRELRARKAGHRRGPCLRWQNMDAVPRLD